MNWSDIDFAPPPRTLRQFAGLWLVFFSGLAAWHRHHHGPTVLASVLATGALGVGLLGICKPGAIRPLLVGLTVLTFPVGWVVSRLILVVLFYGLFTPVGLLFRRIGRDPLGLQRRPEAETYWRPKPAAAGVRSYFRQF